MVIKNRTKERALTNAVTGGQAKQSRGGGQLGRRPVRRRGDRVGRHRRSDGGDEDAQVAVVESARRIAVGGGFDQRLGPRAELVRRRWSGAGLQPVDGVRWNHRPCRLFLPLSSWRAR